jgi:hypothetical protein
MDKPTTGKNALQQVNVRLWAETHKQLVYLQALTQLNRGERKTLTELIDEAIEEKLERLTKE